MSRENVSLVIDFLSYLTLFAGAFSLLTLLTLLLAHITKMRNSIISQVILFLRTNALSFVLLFSAVAMLGSLFLSELAEFTPCLLCWYQRVFMYPIAIIAGIALFRGDKRIFVYILPLAFIGLGIAVYHYLIQMFPGAIQCSDEIASCSARQFANFGFITIPFMSMVAYLNIILMSLFGLRGNK